MNKMRTQEEYRGFKVIQVPEEIIHNKYRDPKVELKKYFGTYNIDSVIIQWLKGKDFSS